MPRDADKPLEPWRTPHGSSPSLEHLLAAQRELRRRGWRRAPVILTILPLTVGALYLILLGLQASFRPDTPPGGWVINPPFFAPLVAAGYGSAFALPVLFRPMFRRWRERDAASGLVVVHRLGPIRRALLYVLMCAIGALVCLAAFFSCTAFTVISREEFRPGNPIRPAVYTYDRITRISLAPDGWYVEGPAAFGPVLYLYSGDELIDFVGRQNGLSAAEVDAIAEFISERSGVAITTDPRARPAGRRPRTPRPVARVPFSRDGA